MNIKEPEQADDEDFDDGEPKAENKQKKLSPEEQKAQNILAKQKANRRESERDLAYLRKQMHRKKNVMQGKAGSDVDPEDLDGSFSV